jgi:hypothetical protein
LLSFPLLSADEGGVSGFRIGLEAHGQGGHQAMKARLYRTAVTVSMVAVLLEGLGATWKWS